MAHTPQIANQGDALFDAGPSPGFLKSIFPCLRKGGSSASGGSMAWVKLVDDEGRVAGHAVLSARVSMALLHAAVGGRVGTRKRLQPAGMAAACCPAPPPARLLHTPRV
jgi:hypothetical protein